MQNNKILSINAIKDLDLEVLYLGGNNIIDISPIRNMKNLCDLEIAANPIKSIDALGELEELKSLNLDKCNLSNIDYKKIQKCTNLELLRCTINGLEDIGFVSELKKLNIYILMIIIYMI